MGHIPPYKFIQSIYRIQKHEKGTITFENMMGANSNQDLYH